MMELPEELEGLITWDGFDEAFLGVLFRCGTSEPIACYDAEKMREILARDMSYEEASEFLEFNTFGAYVGERTPFHLERLTVDAILAPEVPENTAPYRPDPDTMPTVREGWEG